MEKTACKYAVVYTSHFLQMDLNFVAFFALGYKFELYLRYRSLLLIRSPWSGLYIPSFATEYTRTPVREDEQMVTHNTNILVCL